jgi:methionyl-tRNA formyltransferase
MPRTPQPIEGVTYAHKIDKAEAAVDWTLPAQQLERRLRAFDPFPGATGLLDGETVKLWRGEVRTGSGRPGSVLASGPEGLEVACGSGSLLLTELQRPGGKRLPAAAWLQSRPVAPGSAFGQAD